MSFSAMAWATKQKVPATQKLVLLMLASMADNDKGICWPKHSTLAEDCSLSDRSVRDQLKGLESAGLIEIIHRSIEGVSLSNCYRLNLAGVGQQLPGGVAAGSGGVWQQLPGVGQQVPTDTVIDTVIEKQSEKQPGKPGKKVRTKLADFPEEFQAVWSAASPEARDRSGLLVAFKAWGESGAAKDPQMALRAVCAIAQTRDWKNGFAKGLHIWLKNGGWMEAATDSQTLSPETPAYGRKINFEEMRHRND